MEQGLDLFAIWRMIIKRWYLFLILPILSAGIFYYYSIYNYSPVYTASATMMITRPASITPVSQHDVYLYRTLVSTYKEIVLSRRILNVVAEDELIPYSSDQLRGKLKVDGVENTELIQIAATDPDPVLASYIANIVSRVFMDQIGSVIRGAYVSILDESPVPRRPSNPMADRDIIIFAIFGVFVAMGLAFLIDYVDQSIKEPDEAEKLLELPVIGIVPKEKGKTTSIILRGRSPQAEAVRTLRTNIQFASADKQIRRILVTGANPACGKSTISANLAIALAQTGRNVLLVDSDLRRPTQQKIFELESKLGLSSLVYQDDLNPNEVIMDTGKNGLKIILSGPIPPYPAEMLSSQRMKKLVNWFSQHYDFIVFDSPPVLAVTDAVVLSSMVDGTLLIIDYGRVRRDEAASALKQLQRAQAKVIGSVLNAVPFSKVYYDRYKSYYGAEDQKRDRKHKAAN